MKFLKILILTFAVVIFSCNKEKDEIIKEKTKIEILTDGEWTLVKMVSYDDGILDFEYNRNDDGSYFFYTFKKDKTFLLKNYISDSETTGKWEFTDNEKSIKLTIGLNKKRVLHINELTETSLIFVEYIETGDDSEYKTTETYKRI